ncbi:aldolase [Aspergillus filifer]
MATKTGLDILRERSFVDCDTLDEEVAKLFGPIQDCTTNQALAVTELSKPGNKDLIREALVVENKLLPRFPTVDCFQLAVETAMVKLALKIVSCIKGCIHIQTNPDYAYDMGETIANGFRIVQIFQYLAPWFDPTRICITIPSTWEGLMACKTLDVAGVRTSATALFTFDQAILATKMRCTYVAPYVNQLKVHV